MARNEKKSSFIVNMILLLLTSLIGTTALLSVISASYNIGFIPAVEFVLDFYTLVRNCAFEFASPYITCVFQFISIDISLVDPWKDVITVSFLYISTVSWDAQQGAKFKKLGILWRFASGLLAIGLASQISIWITNLSTETIFLTDKSILSEQPGFWLPIYTTLSLSLFRIFLSLQIAVDTTLRNLSENRTIPAHEQRTSRDILKEGRKLFRAKFITSLTIWSVVAVDWVWSVVGAFVFPYETVGAIYLILFVFLLALFHLNMDKKNKNIKFWQNRSFRQTYKIKSGNFEVAMSLFALAALVLIVLILFSSIWSLA